MFGKKRLPIENTRMPVKIHCGICREKMLLSIFAATDFYFGMTIQISFQTFGHNLSLGNYFDMFRNIIAEILSLKSG